MKKTKVMVIIIMFMVVAVKSYAVLVTGMETISAGDPITAEPIQNNYDQIVNVVNGQIEGCGVNMQTSSVCSSDIRDGSITNADISATAGIVDTKLAQITTAGKVSTSAITGTLPLTSHGDYSSATSTMHSASSTYVADPGSYFDSTNVEGALFELASRIPLSGNVKILGFDSAAAITDISITIATDTLQFATAGIYVVLGGYAAIGGDSNMFVTIGIDGIYLCDDDDTSWDDVKYSIKERHVPSVSGYQNPMRIMKISQDELSGNSHYTSTFDATGAHTFTAAYTNYSFTNVFMLIFTF